MARSKKLVLSLALAVIFTSGCAFSPMAAYMDVTMPFHPVIGRTGPKRGEACSTNIMGVYSTGDHGIEAARKKGGITNISNVDSKMTTILGVYSTFCTIVHGS